MLNQNTKYLIALSLLTAALAVPASAGLIVTPASQSIAVGDSTSVTIDISGLGNGVAPALASYTGLVVSYDSSVLTPTGVTLSNRLGDPTDPLQTLLLSDVFLPSKVELDGISFLTGAQLFAAQSTPTGQFTIATITFNGIASGVSLLNLSYGALSDENSNAITESVTNGQITVGMGGIPEPGTFGLLLASGLIALGTHRRRRDRSHYGARN